MLVGVCFTQKTNVDLSVNHNSLNIKILSQITTENQRNFWKEREGEIEIVLVIFQFRNLSSSPSHLVNKLGLRAV